MHEIFPIPVLYLPAGHKVHALEELVYFPGPQALQASVSFPLMPVALCPDGQSTQDPAMPQTD